MNAAKKDLYQEITNKIVSALEKGTMPWTKNFGNGNHVAGPVSRPLRFNLKPYSGINVLVLWLTAHEKGYQSPIWMTYRQAQELGGNVRQGEKGTYVVYANSFKKNETKEDGEESTKNIFFLKSYVVFNVEQIDGLPESYYQKVGGFENQDVRDIDAENYISSIGADIRFGGDRAFYHRGLDYIQVTEFEKFKTSDDYYATVFHELIHWTSHKSRLDRVLLGTYGSEAYAMEELVAELGAAFVCADLSVASSVMPSHEAYIAGWIKVLKNDKKAIFKAASLASRATEYLHEKAGRTVEAESEIA